MKARIGLILVLVAGSAHADLLVPTGSKGTLSVQYEYLAIGQKADQYDPREWQVSRKLSLETQMAADRQTHIASARKKLAPTMNDMMKIADRCGDNEGCITRAVAVDGPRYQLWQPLSQRGTYSVHEMYRGQTADPACMDRPNQRCNRQETRKGGGEIPPSPGKANPSTALFEVDSAKMEVLMTLPVPLMPLGYTREVASDFPDEVRGTSQGVLTNPFGKVRPIRVTIPGDLRSASGTRTIKLDGQEGESGTLTVKWQFELR